MTGTGTVIGRWWLAAVFVALAVVARATSGGGSATWPWVDRREFPNFLRDLGARLVAAPTDDAVLDVWEQAQRQLGVDCPRVPNAVGSPRVSIGPSYTLGASDVQPEGWRVRNRTLDAGVAAQRGELKAMDDAGVVISADTPDVVYFFKSAWTRQRPPGVLGRDCAIAVSDGKGRLYVIDFSEPRGVMVLPFGPAASPQK